MTVNAVAPPFPKSPGMLDPLFEQKIMLAIFGLFVVLPVSFVGTMVSYRYFGDNALMGYIGGFSFMMFFGGILGYFTVLINKAVQEVQIKVVQENK